MGGVAGIGLSLSWENFGGLQRWSNCSKDYLLNLDGLHFYQFIDSKEVWTAFKITGPLFRAHGGD